MIWKHLSHFHRIVALTGVVLVSSLALPVMAQTYLTPDGSAPSANSVPVAPPLNSSSSIQRKAGSLLIGPNGGDKKLCLNADTEADTNRCIDSWDDVANSLGGPFLKYSPSLSFPSALSGRIPTNYAADPGYVRIEAACSVAGCSDGTRQLYSYLTEAPTGLAGAYGLYALDGNVAANYAGYFTGRLEIYPTIPGGNLGQLCLNGILADPDCIERWTEVASGGGAYLQLQTLGNPVVPDTGAISISGTGRVGSVVIDTPVATTSTTYTCGDGMCTAANGEGFISCAVDCAPIAAFPSGQQTGVTPNMGDQYCSLDPNTPCTTTAACSAAGKGVCQNYTGQVVVSSPATQLPAGSPVNVIVVRSKDAAPTFVPLQGSTYATGSVFDNTTIIYSGLRGPGIANAVVGRDRVTSAGTYYYRAYVGNLYPRYGTVYTPQPPMQAEITYYSLSVQKTLNGGFLLSESPDQQILCVDANMNYCFAYYRAGTTVTVSAEIVNSGYRFLGWSGCNEPTSPTTVLCTVTMTGNMTITANYQSTGAGPDGPGGPVFGDG